MIGCQSVFYYPDKETVFYQPEQFQLHAQDVFFSSKDKKKIHAWLIRAKGPEKGLVVFFHGNAQNLTAHFASLSFLPAEGYSYLIFDYPGYGRSEGKVGTKESVLSGLAAVEWAIAEYSPRPIFIFGGSLGGITALRALEELGPRAEVRGLIIEASFDSYQQIARDKLSQGLLTWPLQWLGYLLISDAWAPQNWGRLEGLPKLVLHGDQDSVVEPRHGERLFRRLSEPKEWLWIRGGQHGDSFWGPNLGYRQRLLDFMEEHRLAPSWGVKTEK